MSFNENGKIKLLTKKIYKKFPLKMQRIWKQYKIQRVPSYVKKLENTNVPFFYCKGFSVNHSEDIYKSQYNQDFYIYNFFFRNKTDGVFIDIGANDPVKLSNTYFFEKIGWKGLAFEPQKRLSEKWAGTRKTVCLPYALGDVEKKIKFTELVNGPDYLAGVSSVFENGGGEYKTKQITVCQKRLSDILEEYKFNHIDYVSLDVEGYELNVLKGINWQKTDITLFSIENNKHSTVLRKYMREHGYRYVAKIGVDDIYLREKNS